MFLDAEIFDLLHFGAVLFSLLDVLIFGIPANLSLVLSQLVFELDCLLFLQLFLALLIQFDLFQILESYLMIISHVLIYVEVVQSLILDLLLLFSSLQFSHLLQRESALIHLIQWFCKLNLSQIATTFLDHPQSFQLVVLGLLFALLSLPISIKL